MKNYLTILFILFTSLAFAQTKLLDDYYKADSLMKVNKFSEAYDIFKIIEPKCNNKDTIYNYIMWYYINATSAIEQKHRDSEQFVKSIKYGLEAMDLIRKAKPYFGEDFASREYWMHKNLIVSYFGLGQLEKAEKHKNILYQAYKEEALPKGLHEYFNFTFYKWGDKNIWGYEWYEELPKDRFSKSFTKIIYYVYSTNEDGTDKDQLYRLHVLMFHNIDPESKIDYILTKRLETAKNEKSGTLYAYTYSEDIDYTKLQKDIRQVLKGNYEPEATSTILKKK